MAASNELDELARKYNTDKRTNDPGQSIYHDYTILYYNLFKDHQQEYQSILELGIWEGASHKMWNDFFPNAIIYGVDNFSGIFKKYTDENPQLNPMQINKMLSDKIDELENLGIVVVPCDQTDKEGLDDAFFGLTFDVIIDDGGHGSWQHQKSFDILWDKVKSGGFYIIEDLAVCLMREFREFEDVRSATTNWLLSMSGKEPFSYYMDQERLFQIQREIQNIHYSGELAIIKKR
jgi:hypothetical protein